MMNDAWYTKTPEEIEKILKTNAAVGLTRKAARIRLRKDGPNALYQIPQSKTRSYIGKIAFDFTSLLLLLTVGVAWIFEYRQTAAVILSVWLINFVLTALTYVKSQQIFSAIYTYSIPEMCVLREGRLVLIDSRSIVCGDVIFLREGDVVVCDARIVSAENLMVVEADLCGGGTPVHKNAENLFDARRGLSEQSNMVFASSTVVGGSGRAIVVATGEDTRIYMKKGPIPLESHSEFPLLRQVKKYCRIQGLAAIALVFVITLLDLVLSLRGGELFDVFLTALCLAVASMSELLWALGYIILARGLAGAALISKEGSGGAIIKNISKIEKLSLLDCIIIDSGSIYDRSRLEITALYTGGKLYRQPDLGRGIKDNSCGIDLLKNALVVSGALHGRSSLAQNTGDFTDGEALLSVAEEARIDLSALAGISPA